MTAAFALMLVLATVPADAPRIELVNAPHVITLDGPIVTLDEPGNMMLAVEKGDPAPGRGCYLPEKDCLDMGRAVHSLRTQNAELRRRPEWWVVAALVASGLLGGALAGYALGQKQ